MTLTDAQRDDFSLLYNYLRIEDKLPERADAIVVGGSGVRTDMADRAAELYHLGVAPLVVFSGFAPPGLGANEADLLADRARELGVPEAAIIRETHATNTGLNIILAAKLLRERNIAVNDVVLVHKPYMTRRFLATAQAQWPQPQPRFYVTSAKYDFDEYLALEESRGLAGRTLRRILNDYNSIKEYPKLGFSSEQPFDKNAEVAYRRLLAVGFAPSPTDDALATRNFEADT